MTLEPTRIRLARERVALSRSALAASLGVGERELAQAPEKLSTALAQTLGCAEQFFRLPATSGIDAERIFFRSPRRTSNAQKLATFTDVRELQRQLRAQGVLFQQQADESTTGPASFVVVDPDGNSILFDQHV